MRYILIISMFMLPFLTSMSHAQEVLECSVNVDCNDKGSMVKAMSKALRFLRSHPHYMVNGRADTCSDGLSSLRKWPEGIFTDNKMSNQLGWCNAGLVEAKKHKKN